MPSAVKACGATAGGKPLEPMDGECRQQLLLSNICMAGLRRLMVVDGESPGGYPGLRRDFFVKSVVNGGSMATLPLDDETMAAVRVLTRAIDQVSESVTEVVAFREVSYALGEVLAERSLSALDYADRSFRRLPAEDRKRVIDVATLLARTEVETRRAARRGPAQATGFLAALNLGRRRPEPESSRQVALRRLRAESA